MSWIQTYTGRQFWPLSPRWQDIDLLDIAHALSNKCRYSGHTKKFYSVAEHSWLMAEHALETRMGPGVARWALIHDAGEAYLPDVPRPLKAKMPEFEAAELNIMLQVQERFNLYPSPELMDAVKLLDTRILLTERVALLEHPPAPWADDIEALEPLPVDIYGDTPCHAEDLFLHMARRLGIH